MVPSVDDLWEGLPRRARDAERDRGVKRYVARWRTADGASRKKRFHTRTEALAWAIKHDRKGSPTDEDTVQTVGDIVRRYRESKRGLSPRGLEAHHYVCDRVIDGLGDVAIVDLDLETVERWLASDAAIAPSSWSKRLTALRKALAEAGLPDPSAGVVVRQRRTIQQFLTIDELVQVARAARQTKPGKHSPKQERPHADLWQAMILLMGTAGPRVSEVIDLNVEHLDIAAGELFVPGTKTIRSRRKIPIGQAVAEMLGDLTNNKQPTDPIFATSKNTRINRSRISERVREASQRALGRSVRAHDLRHTAAALLIEAGGLVAASEILGHAHPGITATVYGHVTPAELRRITGRVDSDLTGLLGISPGRSTWVGPPVDPDEPF